MDGLHRLIEAAKAPADAGVGSCVSAAGDRARKIRLWAALLNFPA